MSEEIKISMMSHGGGWVLVVATAKLRGANHFGTSKSRHETTQEVFWTGDEWSPEINHAHRFKDQSEAAEHRRFHQEILDSLL